MQLASYLVVPAIMAMTAVASPTPTTTIIEKRASTWCDTFGSLATGGYTVYHNNWGAAQATSGNQCTTFTSYSQSANSIAWSTSWTWAGGQGQVKSYSNVALEKINKPLSSIKSIASTWSWSYTGSNLVADVAYDLWLAPSVGANNKYEIMIWLGSYGGAGPISSTGSKIASPKIVGTTWSLFKGSNGDTTVFSFVAPNNIANFNGDLKAFFDYLVSSQGVAKTDVVTSLQAGTEPFSGNNAVFTTSAISIAVQ